MATISEDFPICINVLSAGLNTIEKKYVRLGKGDSIMHRSHAVPIHRPWAREFRYDGARARYLNRQLDPVALMAGNFVSLDDVWTDYDGDSAYGDYTVSGSTATNVRSYEPGMAVVDPWMSTGNTATDYFVTDHLGTTRGLTLPSGSPTDAVTFSAFGEKITGTDHRYGYVGTHGYQSLTSDGSPPGANAPGFLHVGHRYYDPASGRFLQRDPIGLYGGFNVYAYAENAPAIWVDPTGEYSLWPNTGRIRYGPSRPRGAPPSVRRLAFRYGANNAHIWGWRGASIFGGSCLFAAALGATVGYGVDKATEAATGKSLSHRIGEAWFRWRHNGQCPGC